jgi:hypothetical protein
MTILEAVKAVPHRRGCDLVTVGEECSCDYCERIAKGIEAIFDDVRHSSDVPEADLISVFVKASSL